MPKNKPFICIRMDRYALGFDDDTEAQNQCRDGIARLLRNCYPMATIRLPIDYAQDHQGHLTTISPQTVWSQWDVDEEEVIHRILRAIDMCDGISKVVKPHE